METVNYGHNVLYDTGSKWKHGSQIYFATLIYSKNHKIVNKSVTNEAM
jgi:hypothetical protein